MVYKYVLIFLFELRYFTIKHFTTSMELGTPELSKLQTIVIESV